MAEIDDLLKQLRKYNTDVTHCRNEGNGGVPVHYVDDLTRAVAAVLDHVDTARAAHPLTCSVCSHSGADVRRIPGTGPLDVCADPAVCAARSRRVRVGALISGDAKDIPLCVLEFVDSEGDVWHRPATEEEAWHDGQRYDWVTPGGWSTTEGRLGYAPLRVTKVTPLPVLEVTNG